MDGGVCVVVGGKDGHEGMVVKGRAENKHNT